MANDHVTVGIFYEMPSGQIAYTYGFDDRKKTVNYRLDGDTTGRTVTYEEIKTWKPRFDLYDFPDSSDPKLPYLFDLNWDIKYMYDLRRVLTSGHPQLDEIKRAMQNWRDGMARDAYMMADAMLRARDLAMKRAGDLDFDEEDSRTATRGPGF